MSRTYHTEDQKLVKYNFPKWTFDECYTIRDVLYDKGFFINCVSRIACDGKYHDAWQVQREDVPQLVEELFHQRIVAEFQAEGSYKASIIFGYDYSAETIIHAVKRFRNKKVKE